MVIFLLLLVLLLALLLLLLSSLFKPSTLWFVSLLYHTMVYLAFFERDRFLFHCVISCRNIYLILYINVKLWPANIWKTCLHSLTIHEIIKIAILLLAFSIRITGLLRFVLDYKGKINYFDNSGEEPTLATRAVVMAKTFDKNTLASIYGPQVLVIWTKEAEDTCSRRGLSCRHLLAPFRKLCPPFICIEFKILCSTTLVFFLNPT